MNDHPSICDLNEEVRRLMVYGSLAHIVASDCNHFLDDSLICREAVQDAEGIFLLVPGECHILGRPLRLLNSYGAFNMLKL